MEGTREGASLRSDLARGIPGVSILTFEDDGHMPNYHQLTDTSDRLDFDIAWSTVLYGEDIVRHLATDASVSCPD